jgi:hypothetical protein
LLHEIKITQCVPIVIIFIFPSSGPTTLVDKNANVGQMGIAAEGLLPFTKIQVRSQDHRTGLIPLGYHLEKKIGLSADERQIPRLRQP